MKRYFFIHCTKTGGTSLNNQILKTVFREEQTCPTKAERRAEFGAITNLDVLAKNLEKRPHVRFITGHFPYWAKDIMGPNVKTFTILREPVARTLSALRFSKKLYTQDMTLEEIYSQAQSFKNRYHNHMVKLFSLGPESGPEGILQPIEYTEDHLKIALDNLRQTDVIGLTENYEEFCRDLTHRFGWELGNARHDNKTKVEPPPQNLVNRIKRDNILDIRFYRGAQRIIAKRRARAQQ